MAGSKRPRRAFTKSLQLVDEFVERLMSVNGKELSASEREKEDKRVQKEVEDIIKRRDKKEQKEEQARAKGEKEKEDDRVEIKDVLRISEITSIRREVFRGHEVIAFDFEPRKGFKPKTRERGSRKQACGNDLGGRSVLSRWRGSRLG